MAKLQPVRGTHDLMPAEARRHRVVGETARRVSGLYGYDEVVTPIFEFSDVFKRSLGDTTDVVTKEMYSFVDKGGEEITLRPENTAGVVRAVLSNGLLQQGLHGHRPQFRVGQRSRHPHRGRDAHRLFRCYRQMHEGNEAQSYSVRSVDPRSFHAEQQGLVTAMKLGAIGIGSDLVGEWKILAPYDYAAGGI